MAPRAGSLTELGQSLNEALEPLGMWGHRHMARIEALHAARR